MTAQKYIITIVLVAFAVSTLSTVFIAPVKALSYAPANKSHNLIVGYRMPGDRLVLKQSVYKGSSWMKVQVVQKMFNVSRYQRITMVKALDQKVNGKGAYPSILKGGVGHSNVTMKFKSQRGNGINFIVELYAR